MYKRSEIYNSWNNYPKNVQGISLNICKNIVLKNIIFKDQQRSVYIRNMSKKMSCLRRNVIEGEWPLSAEGGNFNLRG